MVRHIVLFRLKESLSQAEKRDIAVRFKTAIEALPEVIGFIGKIEVGLNMHPDRTCGRKGMCGFLKRKFLTKDTISK